MIYRIAATGMLALAAGAGAQTWSTFGDFSAASNPAGPWSYGWTLGSGFTLFDRSAILTPDLAIWTGTQFPANAPCVGINPSPSAQTVPGTTIVVPAQAAWCRPGLNGESAIFRFTAPGPGSYSVNGVFHQIDQSAGVTTNISVVIAGFTLMNLNVVAGGGIVMDPSPARQLAAGDTIDFIVGPAGSSPGSAMEIQGHISGVLSCYANCDASTIPPVLNVGDFVCFLNSFAAADAYANCDSSTTPPVLNVLDFVCFLNRFAAGC